VHANAGSALKYNLEALIMHYLPAKCTVWFIISFSACTLNRIWEKNARAIENAKSV
jgi:hypothetical protein